MKSGFYLSYLSSVENRLKSGHPPLIDMDATIRNLEYTLKDQDISSSPFLIQNITETIRLLRGVMEYKRKQWMKQEEEMGGCPCGCALEEQPTNIKLGSATPHSSD
jgi:hypothetical protein